jgi:glycosyltransferase involved in cell wall biosynthesis
MALLYQTNKIKGYISATRGEGYGLPLIEAAASGIPVVATNWSGHIDFLDKDAAILVGGELKQIHASAVVPNMLIADSQWFAPNDGQAGYALKEVFENYKKYLQGAKKQASISKTRFSLDKMTETLGKILDEKTNPIPKLIPLTLPKLNKIELPKLKKL